MAKCNLGKVNLKAMLVSRFSLAVLGVARWLKQEHFMTYIRSCLHAVLRKVLLHLLAVRCHFVLGFSHPSLPLEDGLGK